jgi:hypothetical protein
MLIIAGLLSLGTLFSLASKYAHVYNLIKNKYDTKLYITRSKQDKLQHTHHQSQ